jgi:LysM repeat protein
VLVGFLIFAAGLIWLAAAGGADATGSGVPPSMYEKQMSQVVVQPGDTLWSIASRAEPKADPRLVIQQIAEINALPSVQIAVGQRIWVPKG